jgi:hypothetical protein
MMFRIEMLAAREGDCLWIEYGDPQDPHRVLIDGGRGRTDKEILKRIRATGQQQVHFELVIITHVDLDHIEGILRLLNTADRPLSVGDIWFNGWRHLDQSDLEGFGPVDGEMLTTILLDESLPWNKAFQRRAIVVPQDGPLPCHELEGGLKLTLLSPAPQQLLALKPVWEEVCRDAGLDPDRQAVREPVPPGTERMGPLDIDELASSPFKPDRKEANGSSIAVLAEFAGKAALLAGDAHADMLLASLKRLPGQSGTDRVAVDAFKLPHHGSKANLSRELLDAIDCHRYLVSTSGARYKHPDPEAIARVVRYGGNQPELFFNYGSRYALLWDNPGWMDDHDYRAKYPEVRGTIAVAL